MQTGKKNHSAVHAHSHEQVYIHTTITQTNSSLMQTPHLCPADRLDPVPLNSCFLAAADWLLDFVTRMPSSANQFQGLSNHIMTALVNTAIPIL